MMDKEVCFSIENNTVYLEQVLVDYNNIPIFFLCSDLQRYYVALCTDTEEFNYIVVKLSLAEVYDLLHGKVPMRDVILKQAEYWDVKTGNGIDSDIVIKKSVNTIDISALPEADACFEILTKQIRLFVKKFDDEFFAKKYYSEKPVETLMFTV